MKFAITLKHFFYIFFLFTLTASMTSSNVQAKETVVKHPGGGRTITMTDRNLEPTNLTMTFDKDGNVVSQTGKHSDGKTDTMTYDPKTGRRESTTLDKDGGKTHLVATKDGKTVTTQTGFNENTRVIEEDAQGNVTETTSRPDGTKSVETFTRLKNANPYATSGQPITTTKTEYGKDGKPDSQTKTTTERWGRGFRQTSREETEYNDKGKPTKTTVKVPGKYGQFRVSEEVEYWANGFRKRIIRRDEKGEITEIYDYDQLGNLKRTSIQPGHKPGTPPTTGTWFVPKNKTKEALKVSSGETNFGEGLGVSRIEGGNFGVPMGSELVKFGGDTQDLGVEREDHSGHYSG